MDEGKEAVVIMEAFRFYSALEHGESCSHPYLRPILIAHKAQAAPPTIPIQCYNGLSPVFIICRLVGRGRLDAVSAILQFSNDLNFPASPSLQASCHFPTGRPPDCQRS
jgi:hypothetical protein